MPVSTGVEEVARVVGVHQVDAAGDGLDPINQADQFLTAFDGRTGRVIDDQARQFEELKPYLVTRWREMRAAASVEP